MNKASTPEGSTPTAVSLRRVLQWRVGLLVAGAVVAVVLGGIVFGLKPMVAKIARAQFVLASVQVEASLDKLFVSPEKLLQMSEGWLGGVAPDLEQPESFNRLFRPVLESLPQITSLVAGTSTGQGWLLLQQPGGHWLNRMSDLPRWGDRHHFFAYDADGQRSDHWERVQYDPRLRSWYGVAMAQPASAQWTAPYTFFTTGDPGISVAKRIALADGRDFVLGFDLMLRDLSQTTMNARVGKHGLALVLTEDFRVLALPAAPPGVEQAVWLTRILEPAADLGLLPLTRALANWPTMDGAGIDAFRVGGVNWLAHVQSYRLGERRFWLLSLAPEADFSPSWWLIVGFLLLGLLAMLIPAVLFARHQAGRIAEPLEALAAASARIGQLDFKATPAVANEIKEVVQLTLAHERMRTLLQDNQARIATQAAELQAQIEALRAAEAKITESEAYNHLLFTDSRVAMVVLDPVSGRVLDCNPAAVQIYRLADVQAVIGLTPADVSAPEQYDGTPSTLAAASKIEQALSDGAIIFDWHHRRPDGSLWDAEVHLSPFRQRDQLLLQIALLDVSDRKRAEEELRLAASVFTHAREGILITSADGTILDVNESFSRITLYARADVLGKNPRLLASGRHDPAFYATMWKDLIEKGHWYGEVWDRRRNGEIYAAMLTISAVHDRRGTVLQYVALFSDITALKTHQRQLEHIAHFDALTTLPNRVLLADRLHQAMAQEPRRGQLLAVAYLDLDGFKSINDKHGHEIGDQLLIALASRMKMTLREGDTLARLGGDEFVAVLLDLPDVAACVPMLSRLLVAAAAPTPVGDLALKVSASLGVTFYPQSDEVDADQLLRQADQAMDQAKQTGKNRYHIFDAEQDRSVRGHHETLVHIRRALVAGEFVLYYQPKVNMRTGQVIGAEALIRWQHPERGLLPPAVFLPVIEDHPLAVDVGEWVIDTALTQIERWQNEGLHLPVSVNVGARQLQQIDFTLRLRALLANHPGVVPGDLEMEVLETSALEDLDRVAQVIESCRELGIRFALDDFGTGYSSLTYLKRLAATQLKIDQSFVRNMLDDPDDLSILGGVLSLANAFRRQVIAEGVETVEHGTMLLQLGCELAQGYGIARPMPADELPAWRAAWRPEAAWSNLRPVDHADFALLFAGVEHRAWVIAVEAFLCGERDNLPLVHHHCRFDEWLEADGLTHHGKQAEFRAIDPLHRDMHAFASRLCEATVDARMLAFSALASTSASASVNTPPSILASQGALRENIEELHRLRDAFLAQLDVLVRKGMDS